MKRRSRLYTAISHCLSAPKTSALAVIPMLVTPGLAFSATIEKWHCGADEKGQWVCSVKAEEGRLYARPYHAESEARPEDSGPIVRRAKNLDWVEEEFLTEQQKARIEPGCCGAYIEPERSYEDADVEPSNAPLRVAAGSTEVMADNVAKLEGGVQLTQGNRQIRGESALVDQQNRVAEITGNVQFREPGILIKGESAKVNLDTKDIDVKEISYLFHDSGVRGTADRMQRHKGDIYYIDNATYTTCEPGNDSWQLDTGYLKLNRENSMATAKNVKLKVKGIPVLYLPWLMFPVGDHRTTGLLFPHLELTSDNGFDYGQPVYLNLAPNYDMTVSPRYIEKRGAALELEGRHLSPITYTVAGGGYLANDDGGDDKDIATRLHEGENRWIAQLNHQGGFGKQWRTNIDYTKVSDIDYFSDLDITTLQASRRTHLTQKAIVGYKFDHWDASITGHRLQTISDSIFVDEDYQAIPLVNVNGYYQLGDFIATLNNQFGNFDHEQKYDRFGKRLAVGERTHIDYNITWDKRWQWGYFEPKAGFRHISYNLSNTPTPEQSPSATIPVFSFDSGIYLERQTNWIGNYIQTFEPRLYGLYVDFEDQSDFPEFDTTERTFSYDQLFRDNRFIGGDRVGDAQQISIGLTTRLLKASTGKEVFRASLGQAHYFDDRQVTLSSILPSSLKQDQSTYAGELAFALGDYWNFNSSILFNEDNGVIEKGSVYLGYEGEDKQLFNLGYRYTRKLPRFDIASTQFIDTNIEQADLSTYLPIAGNWNMVARWNYDFINSRELETFAGIEYNSCCWRVSVLARKWLDRNDDLLIPEEDLKDDTGLFVQIQFKGLGGTSKKIDSILSDGIFGYEKPD